MLLIFFVLNVCCYGLMFADKRAAQVRARRVPEALLIMLGLIGGVYGLIIGMKLFRHKTRKAAFYGPVWGIALLQVVAAVYFLF